LPNGMSVAGELLNLEVLDRLLIGQSAQKAVDGVTERNPEADVGLIAVDRSGEVWSRNSERVRRRPARPTPAISPRVRPALAPGWSGVVGPAVFRLSQPESLVPMSGFDQTVGRSAGETHASASDPTSAPSGFPCNRSGVFASSATLLLLAQSLVCCIDRLNPQST
jgi:hypothetical protein